MSMGNRTPIPAENFLDNITRVDELLVIQVGLLKSIAAKLGVPTDGNPGTPSDLGGIKNLQIVTLPLGASANVEVPFQFAIGTKSFIIHARNGNAVRMATQQGVVAASQEPYFTLKAGTVYTQDDLLIRDFTQKFYFACSVASEVLEIIQGV